MPSRGELLQDFSTLVRQFFLHPDAPLTSVPPQGCRRASTHLRRACNLQPDSLRSPRRSRPSGPDLALHSLRQSRPARCLSIDSPPAAADRPAQRPRSLLRFTDFTIMLNGASQVPSVSGVSYVNYVGISFVTRAFASPRSSPHPFRHADCSLRYEQSTSSSAIGTDGGQR